MQSVTVDRIIFLNNLGYRGSWGGIKYVWWQRVNRMRWWTTKYAETVPTDFKDWVRKSLQNMKAAVWTHKDKVHKEIEYEFGHGEITEQEKNAKHEELNKIDHGTLREKRLKICEMHESAAKRQLSMVQKLYDDIEGLSLKPDEKTDLKFVLRVYHEQLYIGHHTIDWSSHHGGYKTLTDSYNSLLDGVFLAALKKNSDAKDKRIEYTIKDTIKYVDEATRVWHKAQNVYNKDRDYNEIDLIQRRLMVIKSEQGKRAIASLLKASSEWKSATERINKQSGKVRDVIKLLRSKLPKHSVDTTHWGYSQDLNIAKILEKCDVDCVSAYCHKWLEKKSERVTGRLGANEIAFAILYASQPLSYVTETTSKKVFRTFRKMEDRDRAIILRAIIEGIKKMDNKSSLILQEEMWCGYDTNWVQTVIHDAFMYPYAPGHGEGDFLYDEGKTPDAEAIAAVIRGSFRAKMGFSL